MNTIDPKVELIDMMDNRRRAWKYSRPGFDHEHLDMEKIGSMDMTLNSLCMLTFEISSSLIFRDWLFTIRPIFPWARSSRSAPLTLSNTLTSSEFGGVGDGRILHVIDKINNGVPQDQAREGLPLSMSTSYTVSMDFRTACGMIQTMKAISPLMYDTYGIQFINQMAHIPGFQTSTVRTFHDTYALGGQELGKRVTVKFALMSQLIRSSNASFKNGLWNMITGDGYMRVGILSQADVIQMDMQMEYYAYEKLMKLRSHWFADWSTDMWGTMVGDYTIDMPTDEFWKFIPNGDGKKDPYHRDMISRVTGEEHNLPCPIMLEYPDLVWQRRELHGDNPVIRKYLDLVHCNYIRNNPENELRIQYEAAKNNK